MTEPEHISADDLTYHAFVLANLRIAQAAVELWASYLARKYHMGPADRVEEDGRIIRPGRQEGDS